MRHYYPDAIAGKTGYTSQAGQTLVTYARRGDRGQITVTLKSTDKTHYSDTITLMEFGFNHFYNLNISENETEYVTGSDAVELGGVSICPRSSTMTVPLSSPCPMTACLRTRKKSLVTDLPEDRPENAVALMRYTYNERQIGQAFLLTTGRKPGNRRPGHAGRGRLPGKSDAAAGRGRNAFRSVGEYFSYRRNHCPGSHYCGESCSSGGESRRKRKESACASGGRNAASGLRISAAPRRNLPDFWRSGEKNTTSKGGR